MHARPILRTLIIVFTIILPAVIPNEAIAKTGLSVCPSHVSFKIPSGFSKTGVFKLSNSGSEEIVVNIKPAAISKNKKGGTIYKTGGTMGGGLASWISVKPSKILLKPKATEYPKLVVTVPSDMQPGNHEAAIIFDVCDAKALNVSIASRIVSSVSLHVEDISSVPQFEVRSFKVGGINIGRPLEFDLDIRNTGKIPYRTSGRIKILSGDDKQVSEIILPNINIPGGSSRNIPIKTKTTLSNGAYRCSAFIENGGCFKGPYTRRLIVFPWVGFLGLIIIAFGLYIGRPRSCRFQNLGSES